MRYPTCRDRIFCGISHNQNITGFGLHNLEIMYNLFSLRNLYSALFSMAGDKINSHDSALSFNKIILYYFRQYSDCTCYNVMTNHLSMIMN